MIPLHQAINLVGVAIALVATYVLYDANSKFLRGDFKNFTNWVVVLSFVFLYHLSFSLYSERANYWGISSENIQSLNMAFTVIIGVILIVCAIILKNFSSKYGLASRMMPSDKGKKPNT